MPFGEKKGEKMHRSSSWSRVSDDYFMHSAASGLRISTSMTEGSAQLPMYDSVIEMAKKERSRAKIAENAVHFIPFVLLVCALILWLFSNPDVDVGVKPDTVAARIDGLTIDGDIDNDSDGTQTGFLPLVDSGDIKTSIEKPKDGNASRKRGNRSLR